MPGCNTYTRGYHMKMFSEDRLENLFQLVGRRFGYTKHPKTRKSLKFGDLLKSLSNGLSLTMLEVFVQLYVKTIVAKVNCQRDCRSPL